MTLKPSALERGRRMAQRTTRTEVIPAGSEWDQPRSHTAGVLVLLAKAIR
jgi:hypothetical protein